MGKKYDLIIVGAGPAGVTAAKFAGEQGLQVALLDRKNDIGNISKVCGQTVSLSSRSLFLGESALFDFKTSEFVFANHGFRLSYDGPYRRMNAINFGSTCGNLIECGTRTEDADINEDECIGIYFDKGIFLKGIVKQAQDAGVEVFTGINVTGVEKTESGVKVIGDSDTFEGTFAIAADGVNSRITQALGFNKERKFFGTMKVAGYHMEGVRPANNNSVYFIFGGSQNPYVFVIFPTYDKDRHIVVVLSINPNVDLEQTFEFITQKSFYAPWFAGAKKGEKASCVANMYSQIPVPFRDNVLILGDAAATEEVAQCGGMIMGWMAAREINRAIKNNKPNQEGLAGFLDFWDKVYLKYYDSKTYVMNWALPVMLDEDEIDYLYGLCSRTPLAGTYDPYDLINDMNRVIERSAPIIQMERPQILAKLQKTAMEPIENTLVNEINGGSPCV